MLGSGPVTASVYTEPASATPSSPTRPSRLRGLSYLRNYTHTHLHSSRADAPPPPPPPPPLTRSTSSPAAHSTPAAVCPTPPPVAIPQPSAVPQSGDNGWHPATGDWGNPTSETLATNVASPEPSASAAIMSRSRAATTQGPTLAATAPTTHGDAAAAATEARSTPTIRFTPHVEARSSRPSLHFTAVSRTLDTPTSVVRVGRYSERDNLTGDPDTLPVGFKSKVVSRRHCEFWCTDGQWYVKDVKSSSGTFLNHVRLSSPGQESRPYPVNDGDVVQLGIDFKGGEEVIFRCVKIRVECNRSWQKSLNNFNTSAHKRLFRSATKDKSRDSDAASVNSSECSICLNSVAPCQALFVAPCSHVWHYKCVRNLIQGPTWPNFLCPNCRAVADLEADVEQPEEEEEEWEEEPALPEQVILLQTSEHHPDDAPSSSEDNPPDHLSASDGHDAPDEQDAGLPQSTKRNHVLIDDLTEAIAQASLHTPMPIDDAPRSRSRSKSPHPAAAAAAATPSQPIAIALPGSSARPAAAGPRDVFAAASTTPTSSSMQFGLAAGSMPDGPMTPRNDAGPFVFDGSAGRQRPESSTFPPAQRLGEPGSVRD